jgi:hypothetical protein
MSHKPMGLHGLLQGQLYLFTFVNTTFGPFFQLRQIYVTGANIQMDKNIYNFIVANFIFFNIPPN